MRRHAFKAALAALTLVATSGVGEASGQVVQLEALPGAAPGSEAWGVNSSGVVVGYSGDDAVRWVPEGSGWRVEGLGRVVVDRDSGEPLPGAFVFAFATGINESGQICAQLRVGSDNRAAIWEGGVFYALPHREGGAGSGARGINNRGDVVGGSSGLATVWIDGSPTTLPTLPGGTSASGFGINDRGEVVGSSNKAPGGPSVPVLWRPAGEGGYEIIELANRVTPTASGIAQGVFARGVSDSGWIAGLDATIHPSAWHADAPGVEHALSANGLGQPGTANSANDEGEFAGFVGKNGAEAEPAYWPGPGADAVRLLHRPGGGFARAISDRDASGTAYVAGFFYDQPDKLNRAFVISLR